MIKKGRGFACIYFGMGNTAKPNPASAYVEMAEDGSVLVRSGAADLGQGSDMALTQITAETLGLEPQSVSIISADTLTTPVAGNSSASRQTYVSGNAVRLAAEEAKKILLREASELLESNLDDLVLEKGQIYVIGSPDRGISIQEVCASLRGRGELISASGYFNPPTPTCWTRRPEPGFPTAPITTPPRWWKCRWTMRPASSRCSGWWPATTWAGW